MTTSRKNKLQAKDFKEVISEYAATKVIDWILRNKVDQGISSQFNWSADDKILLSQVLLNSQHAKDELPIDDKKFKVFFESIIQNGLNTDDVKLFQKYKDKLPLRALGLAYNLSDFETNNKGIISIDRLTAGYYMLEIAISPKSYNSRLPVVLSTSSQDSNSSINFLLYAQSEKMAKRLIKLDEDVHLSVFANTKWAIKDIKHFKLAKLSKLFFISRMCKKLNYKIQAPSHLNLNDTTFAQLWEQYDKIFTNNFNINNNTNINSIYQDAILHLEKRASSSIPDVMKKVMQK